MIRLLFIAILFNIPTLADTTITPGGSATTWEMYVLGGASVFFDLFNSINFFVSSQSFYVLSAFVALCGFIVLMAKNVGGIDPKMIAAYFLTIWGVSFATFNLKIDLTIIDSVGSNPADTSRVITGVPASIGLPAAWISDLGESFTNMVEQNFSHVNDTLRFSNTKTINMEAKVIKDAMTIHPYSPELTKSLGEFYKDCVFPIVAEGSITVSQLINSPDFSSLIAANLNPAIQTIDYSTNAAGVMRGCEEAWTNSTDGYQVKIDSAVATIVGANVNFGPDRTQIDNTGLATASMDTLVGAILSNVSHGSATTSASTLVKSRSLARSFHAGTRSAAAGTQYDLDSLPDMLIEEQALAQQTEGWKMAISAFNAMAIYIFTVLHAFIIGVSPIILILAFLPGVATKTLLNYLQILFWLTLWQPMLSIVNYIIISFQNNTMATILNASSSDYVNPTSPVAWSGINEALDNYTLAAGFLGTMVPMISWGILKGGMNFSQFISSGIGTSVAQGAAKNLATGTLSMDNKSFNNTSANKFNTMDSITTGQGLATFSSIAGNASQLSFDTGGIDTKYQGDSIEIDKNYQAQRVQAVTGSYGVTAQDSAKDSATTMMNTLFARQRQAQTAYNHALQTGNTAELREASTKLQTLNNAIELGTSTQSGEKTGVNDQLAAKKNGAAIGANLLMETLRSSNNPDQLINLANNSPELAISQINRNFDERYENDAVFKHAVDNNLKRQYPGKSHEEALSEFKQKNANETVALLQGKDGDAGELGKQVAASVGANALQDGIKEAAGATKNIPIIGTLLGAANGVQKNLIPRVEFSATSTSTNSSEAGLGYKALTGDSSQKIAQIQDNLGNANTFAETFDEKQLEALSHVLSDTEMQQFSTARENIIAQNKGYNEKLESSKSLSASIQIADHMSPTEVNELLTSLNAFESKMPDPVSSKPSPLTEEEIMKLGDGAPAPSAVEVGETKASQVLDGQTEGGNSVRAEVTTETTDTTTEEAVKAKNIEEQLKTTSNRVSEEKLGTQINIASLGEDVLSEMINISDEVLTNHDGTINNAIKSETMEAARQGISETLPEDFLKTVRSARHVADGHTDVIPLNDNSFEIGDFTASSAIVTNNGGQLESQFVFTREGDIDQQGNPIKYTYDRENGVMAAIGDVNDSNYVMNQSEQGNLNAFEHYGSDLHGNAVFINQSGKVSSQESLEEFIGKGDGIIMSDQELENAYQAVELGNQMRVEQSTNSNLDNYTSQMDKTDLQNYILDARTNGNETEIEAIRDYADQLRTPVEGESEYEKMSREANVMLIDTYLGDKK